MKLIPIPATGEPDGLVGIHAELLREICLHTQSMYASVGFVPPWIGYLAMQENEYIGTCGFKGPPQSCRVEIAYFTLPEFENRGIATEMARKLIELAGQTDPQIQVIAQTLPNENASTSILKKLGFQHFGTIQHPEDGPVWEWHLVKDR